MSFSKNLRQLMEKRGVTQGSLGKSVGCAQSTIARILAGDQDDSSKYSRYAPAIALYFNVTLEELLGTSNVPTYLKRAMDRIGELPESTPTHAFRAENPAKQVAIGELPAIAGTASMLVVWDKATPEVPLSPGAILAIYRQRPANLAFVAAKIGERIEILQHIHTRITGSQYYRLGTDSPEQEPDPDILGPFAIFPVPA